MSKFLKPKSGIENLSSDCWQLVFNHLDEDDLKTVSSFCTDFLTNSNLAKRNLKVVHPKGSMLSQYLKRFTQLKRIDLSNFEGDLDEAICEILGSALSLEALHCCPEAVFKMETLGSSPKMKSLKALTFNGINYLSDNDLVVIANSFPNLEELDFGLNWWNPGHAIGDHAIQYLASKLKLLKKFNLCVKNMIYDQSVFALSVNCPFLKDVSIYSYGGTLTQNGIGLLLRNSPNLEALTIGSISMYSSTTITIENSISYAKALTSLNFIHMDISDNLLKEIAKAKLRLKDVGLIDCRKFTVSGLKMVSSNYLNKLKICACDYNILDADLTLFLMGDVSNLTHIQLHRCRFTNSTFFLLLNRCPSLVEIKIKRTRLDVELNNLQLCKKHKIQHIYLTYCTISDELLKQFALSFPELNVLYLDWCHSFASTGIEVILGSCKFMTKLIITLGSFSDLKFENPLSLEVLTLAVSDIVNDVLATVAEKCHRLMSLDLNNCKKVTTEGIKRILENIKSLACLNIYYCAAVNSGDLLEWMLSTGFLASLKKITLPRKTDASEEQRDEFLRRGCLLL